VGIDITLAKKSIKRSTKAANLKNLDLNPDRFGIAGRLPVRSIPLEPVVMDILRHGSVSEATHHYSSYTTYE
jgi:hypothetical protein